MKIPLNRIEANPHRNIDHYPRQPVKIAALVSSINDTDFWENVVVRENPDRPGWFQLAYGHHRLFALREIHGENSRKEFDWIVRDLSDDQMCKVMIRENAQEFGSDSSVEMESIRAVVEGYAAGTVILPPLPKKTPQSAVRYAPGFKRGDVPPALREHPYTIAQLLEYTGWKSERKVETALKALEAIEAGKLSRETFAPDEKDENKRVGTTGAEVIVTEVNRVRNQYEREAIKAEREGDSSAARKIRADGERVAKKVEKTLAAGIRTGEVTQRGSRAKAEEITATEKGMPEFPDINPVTGRLAMKIEHLLDEDKDLGERVRQIIKHQKSLSPEYARQLKMALNTLADEARELATKVKTEATVREVKQQKRLA